MATIRCILCAQPVADGLACRACDATIHERCRARDRGCPACGTAEELLRWVPPPRKPWLTRRALLLAPLAAVGGVVAVPFVRELAVRRHLDRARERERECDFAAALEDAREALALATGESHASAAHLEGRLLATLGRYAEADGAFARMSLFGERFVTPEALDDHGVLKRLRGQYRECAQRHVSAAEHPKATLLSRAWSRIRQAEHDLALAELGPAIALLERALVETSRAGSHVDPLLPAHIHDLMGRCVEDSYGPARANSYYMRAYKLVQRELGVHREPGIQPVRRASLEMLAGWCLHAQGQYQPAKLRYARALELRRVHEGRRRLPVAASLSRLAWIARISGDVAGARAMLDEALELRTQTFHTEHPMIAETLEQIASLYEQQPIDIVERAQRIRRKALEGYGPYGYGSHHFQRMLLMSPLTLWRV